jgi:hypothetical protein
LCGGRAEHYRNALPLHAWGPSHIDRGGATAATFAPSGNAAEISTTHGRVGVAGQDRDDLVDDLHQAHLRCRGWHLGRRMERFQLHGTGCCLGPARNEGATASTTRAGHHTTCGLPNQAARDGLDSLTGADIAGSARPRCRAREVGGPSYWQKPSREPRHCTAAFARDKTASPRKGSASVLAHKERDLRCRPDVIDQARTDSGGDAEHLMWAREVVVHCIEAADPNAITMVNMRVATPRDRETASSAPDERCRQMCQSPPAPGEARCATNSLAAPTCPGR